MVSKVFNAFYFPRHSFLDTNVGYKPSYACISIVKGMDTLEKRDRWRVGVGDKIRFRGLIVA